MRILIIVFAAALVTIAFGLLFYPRDRRLSWILLGAGSLLMVILAGGFFGLFGS